jgi:type I restriction enzyme, R subunit
VTTDVSERGLERLICTALAGSTCDPDPGATVPEPPSSQGVGWLCGAPGDYDREYCVDLAQLSAFLHETQAEIATSLSLDQDGPTRRKFLARIQGEVTKRGTIDVLRHGVKHGPHHIDLFYGTPSPGNANATQPTDSPSRASCATAATRHSERLTLASSSTAYLSPPSS